MPQTLYSSPQIAIAFKNRFGDQMKSLKNVEMQFTREVGRFIRQGNEAHKATAKSSLVFK